MRAQALTLILDYRMVGAPNHFRYSALSSSSPPSLLGVIPRPALAEFPFGSGEKLRETEVKDIGENDHQSQRRVLAGSSMLTQDVEYPAFSPSFP